MALQGMVSVAVAIMMWQQFNLLKVYAHPGSDFHDDYLTREAPAAYPKSQVSWFEVVPPIRNCRDVQKQGTNTSGVYTIYPYNCCPQRPLQVFCDMETDGGGWTVIQRRDDIEPRRDFFLTWMEYALGFGDLMGEFWLGNDNINALTDQCRNELRFDLEDFDNVTRWAKYAFFYVHDRASSYRMESNSYTGNAGDSFLYHSGQRFSTKDKDLDTFDSTHCAEKYKGAWWYRACYRSNLNGFSYGGSQTTSPDGISWNDWRGSSYSLKKTSMKIRPTA